MAERADYLLSGTVITMDPLRRVFSDGAVAVRDGRIVAVGEKKEIIGQYEAPVALGGRRRVVIPGLIDTHNHLGQSLIRELAIEDHQNVLRVYVPAERVMCLDDVRVSAQYGLAQLLRAGVTTLAETTGTREHEDVVARAVVDAGIRCAMARGQGDRQSTYVGTYGQISSRSSAVDDPGRLADDEAASRDFLERWTNSRETMLRPWIHTHSISTCSDERFLRMQELAGSFGTGVMHHINRDRDEIELSLALSGQRPIEHLNTIGGLGSNVLCVHAMLTTDREIQMLAAADAKVAHAPIVSGDILSAVARVPAMRAAGVTVGLACDTVINDILAVMRIAVVTHAQQTATSLYDALSLTTDDVFAMGTIDGARALLWEDEIGSIEVGKAADVVVVDGDKLRLAPVHNPVAVLARYASGSDVESVLIAGKLVVDRGRVLTLDESLLLEEAHDVAARLRQMIEPLRYGPLSRQSQLA